MPYVNLCSLLNLITCFGREINEKYLKQKNEVYGCGRTVEAYVSGAGGAKRLIIFIDRKKVPDLAWTLTALLGRFQLFTDILSRIPKNTDRLKGVVLILCPISTCQL